MVRLAVTLLPLSLVLLLFLTDGTAGGGFACNIDALDDKERVRHRELSQALIGAALETKELPEGYGFRFAAKNLTTAAEWVSLEARCCPFFTFVLEQARDQGPLWLEVTGPEGVKAFIRTEFGL
jgi:hypothetical protein